jgi:hypothetical protein
MRLFVADSKANPAGWPYTARRRYRPWSLVEAGTYPSRIGKYNGRTTLRVGACDADLDDGQGASRVVIRN